MIYEKAVDELLIYGYDDWVPVPAVAWIAKSVCKGKSLLEIQDISLEIIRYVVKQDLMEIGDVNKSGFHKWDMTTEKALKRVEDEWRALKPGRVVGFHVDGSEATTDNPLPELGEICWLCNTDKGNELAKKLLGE